MNMISKFIRQWKAFRLSLRLLKLIDPKKLEDLNVILEEIYPGIRAEIQALVESSDIHAMSKTLHYMTMSFSSISNQSLTLPASS